MALRSFLMFVFGLCATVFLTEVGKISSGVLRPNFIDLCDPNVTCAGRDPGRDCISRLSGCMRTDDGLARPDSSLAAINSNCNRRRRRRNGSERRASKSYGDSVQMR